MTAHPRHSKAVAALQTLASATHEARMVLMGYGNAETKELEDQLVHVTIDTEHLIDKLGEDDLRVIDERIIREVMGWPIAEVDTIPHPVSPIPVAFYNSHTDSYMVFLDDKDTAIPFKPSEDMTAAMRVSEKINATYNNPLYWLRLSYYTYSGGVDGSGCEAAWGRRDEDNYDEPMSASGRHGSPPMAICEGALRWAEYRKGGYV